MFFQKCLYLACFATILLYLNTLFLHNDSISSRYQLHKRSIEKINSRWLNIDKSADEVTQLIKLLFQVDAFILEIDFLKELQNHEFKNIIEYVRFNYEFFKGYFHNDKSKQLTFGIMNDTLHHDEIEDIFDKEKLKKDFDLECNVNKSTGFYMNKTVTTNIYLNCSQIIIQLSVLYKRGEYLWLGADESSSGYRQKWFGDVPRALNSFETDFIRDNYTTLIQLPSNLRRFIFDYEQSMFYECNRSLFESNTKIYGEKYKQDPVKNAKIFSGMKYFKRIMDTLYKPFFITSGTLLGWYRDCGIITHTTDVDFGMFSEDYDPAIKRAFLGNRQMRLSLQYGIPDKGLEYRFHNGFFYNDLFFYYKINQTHFYSPYHGSTRMYKQVYSIFNKICSADLFGVKFPIPCNPVKVILEDYGVNFTVPMASGYSWSSLNMKIYEQFNESTWSLSRRSYQKNGKVDLEETLKDLNEHVKDDGVPKTEIIVEDLE